MSSFVNTDPASWTEENLEAQNVRTLKAVVENLGLVLDKDDQRRSRPGNARFVKGDFKLMMLVTLAAIPLTLLLRKPDHSGGGESAAAAME